jgi:hypothetical protein
VKTLYLSSDEVSQSVNPNWLQHVQTETPMVSEFGSELAAARSLLNLVAAELATLTRRPAIQTER